MSISFETAKHQIIEAGRRLDRLHLAPATSGNYSVRLVDDKVAITVSGTHKGLLREEDVMCVDMDGKALEEKRPSAETLLHCQLYRQYKDIGAILHTHSVASTVLTRFETDKDALVLEGYELLKAFGEIKTHETTVKLPIFDNTQDMEQLSKQVDALLDQEPRTPAYLIRGHGVYGWGRDMNEALRVIEATEMLLSCEMHMIQMKATGA